MFYPPSTTIKKLIELEYDWGKGWVFIGVHKAQLTASHIAIWIL